MNEFKGMPRKEMLSAMNEAQKKQYRMSIVLYLISLCLAGLLGLLVTAMESVRRMVPYITTDEVWEVIGGSLPQAKALTLAAWNEVLKGHLLFSVAAFCIAIYILVCFGRVCREIGRDNSFSEENVRNFRQMMWLSLAGGGCYLLRLFLYLTRCIGAGYPRAASILALLYGTMMALFLIFAVLCRALAKLVHNAYEVKLENDLTI